MTREFRYQPAALRETWTVRYDRRGMQQGAGDRLGPWRDWADLEEVGFSLRSGPKLGFLNLYLGFGGAKEVIGQTGEGVEDGDLMEEIGRILIEIAAARPEMEVALGETGGARVAMGIVGVLLLLVGIFLVFVAVYLVGEGDWPVAVVMGPMGLLAAWVGGALGKTLLPGDRVQRVRIGDLVQRVSGESADALSDATAAQNAEAEAGADRPGR